jgi:hypothetical protein
VVEFYIKLKLILGIIIDHFVIKSDNLGGIFNFKTILIISCTMTILHVWNSARRGFCMHVFSCNNNKIFQFILIKKTAQSITKIGWYKSVISV